MTGRMTDFVKWLAGHDDKRAISRQAEKAGEKEQDKALNEFVSASSELKQAMTDLAEAIDKANRPRRRLRHRSKKNGS